MTTRRIFLTALPAFGSLAAVTARPAFAQAWPSRAIRLVVPVAPGSGTDLVARQISGGLARALPGASAVVENRPGAGGVIAVDMVAKAPADGYTVLVNHSGQYTAPAMEKTAYDPVADFIVVAQMLLSTLVFVVAPDSPFKTVADVVAAARRAPRSVSFASAGLGTTSHMGGALLASQAGIELTHIPYTNGSQAMIDTSTGQVQTAFSGPAALPLVKAGKLRLLATTGLRRSSLFPDVPTLRETPGLGDYEVVSPIWAFVPKGTPADVVKRLSDACSAIATSAEYRTFCAEQALDPTFLPNAIAGPAAAAEAARWRKLVELTRA